MPEGQLGGRDVDVDPLVGRAIDFHIPTMPCGVDRGEAGGHSTCGWCPLRQGSTSCGRARNELGDLLATWLTDNAEAIGVQYLIWDRTSWSVNKRGGTKLYTGSHPHNEHIHVEITEEAGRKETPFFSDPVVPAGVALFGLWPEHDPISTSTTTPTCPHRSWRT